ncbi:peptidylprolyl isomerase [Rhodococcus kronopolitis]|uniref:Peptidylprolyl isomerase n=1 Tax=Rhodococcus kronopolitis TaxID=1460226 RepID=A0ABV9FPE6_9NOCA
MKRSMIVTAGVGLALVVAGCSSGDDAASTPGSTSKTTTASAAPAPTMDMSSFAALPAVPAAAAATVSCEYPAAGQASKPANAPATADVSTAGTATVAMATSQGAIGLTLDRAEAPCTVNSFVSLAEQGYFNDTPCHRLTTGSSLKVLQCGDPAGVGTGGPGYRFANEYPTTAFADGDPAVEEGMVYPRGTVAMANSGPGGTNGSQFFLVYADSVLPPQYTVFGTIDEAGLATLDKVAAGGTASSRGAGDGRPNSAVQIETVTVS